jgi:two-component system, cell cycle sensor histidine kinase and response regulator CckA
MGVITKSTINDKILIDQIYRFSSQVLIGISATLLNSTILATLLLSVVPRHNVLSWLAVSLVVGLMRILIYWYHQKHGVTAESANRQKNILLLSLFVSGCVWGSAPIFIFPYSSVVHQALLTLILAGMVAGSVNAFSYIAAGFFAFTIPAIVPLAVVFFSIGDGMHVALGAMLLVFSFFMILANRRISFEFVNFLVLKYENLDLIEHLEKEITDRKNAEQRLLEKNYQIETIVEERTSELRKVNEKLLSEIDDRIEAEKALKENELKYRELANTLPQIVFETDAHGMITFANRNAFKILGYTEKDLENGLSAFQILDVEQGSSEHAKLLSVLDGQKLYGEEFAARAKDGRLFPISIHSAPVMHSGTSVGMRGIIIDLSEQKRAESEQRKLQAQLQRAQKMELLGTLAGGVAHDLNNILSGIVSYPELLLMQIPEESSLRKPLIVMQESGKKAAAVVQDLLTLARRGVIVEEVLNLNEIITAYLESPEYKNVLSFHPEIKVSTALDEDLLNISGSAVHLSKTVMNLVTNAAEAMPGGGMLHISTSNNYLDQPVKGYDEIKEGDYVVLTVSDNGVGIPPTDIEKIFEPFFTKKLMGRSGTGLGMTVAWGTVKDHNGYIDVTSIENQGSQFRLYFPVTRTTRPDKDPLEPLESFIGKGESILLVDDVAEQLQIASDLLSYLGYSVSIAQSGDEAIDYLRHNRVDLIVLDMIMPPGKDGLDTYREILKLHPAQKAVIASGFSETDRVKQAIQSGAGPYIKKPYTWINLGKAVQTALGAKSR